MSLDYKFYLNLVYISALSICIPLIVGLIFKNNLRPNFTILLYFVCADLLTEIMVHLFRSYHVNNLFVLRIYTVIQFVLLSVFYSKVLSLSKLSFFINIFNFILLSIALIDLYKNGIETTDDLTLTTASILLMIYSLFTFFHMMQNPVHANILSAPLFWFNTAVLLYFSGGLILFIFNSYILKHSYKMHHELWGINSLLNIVFNLLMAIGFWKTKHKQI